MFLFYAAITLAISLLLCSVSAQISEVVQNILNKESWIIPFSVIIILFFFIRFSGQGVLTMSSRNMIMIWFDKNRGKANSFSSIAVSLGFSSSPIFLNSLINEDVWEVTWQILALCLLIFSILILQFYRNKPEDHQLLPDGNKTVSNKETINNSCIKQFTLKEAKKARSFWMYGLILGFNSFFITRSPIIYVFIVGIGFLGGLFAVLNAVTWPRFFGRTHLGAITGKIMSILVLASAIAPRLFSFCFTSLGLYIFIGYFSLIFLSFLFIGSIKANNNNNNNKV